MVNFNAQVCTKVLELPRSDLSPVISDNVIRNAKPLHDLFDELHRLGHCNGSGRLYFDTLCEFIHNDEDVCEYTFSFLKGPSKSSPHVEKGQVIGMVCS
jgi:hypothetical protein